MGKDLGNVFGPFDRRTIRQSVFKQTDALPHQICTRLKVNREELLNDLLVNSLEQLTLRKYKKLHLSFSFSSSSFILSASTICVPLETNLRSKCAR